MRKKDGAKGTGGKDKGKRRAPSGPAPTPAVPPARLSPPAVLEAVGDDPNGVSTEAICQKFGRTPQELGDLFESLIHRGALRGFAGRWFSPRGFQDGANRFLDALKAEHQKTPTVAFLPRERVVHLAGLAWAGKPLDRILSHLEEEGFVATDGTKVKSTDFRLQLSPRQRQLLDRVLAELTKEPVSTPNPHQIARVVSVPPQAVEEILRTGALSGEVVQVGEGVYYTPSQLEAIQQTLRRTLGRRTLSASAVREALNTTRKYVMPLLLHFDEIGFTRWSDDERVIR